MDMFKFEHDLLKQIQNQPVVPEGFQELDNAMFQVDSVKIMDSEDFEYLESQFRGYRSMIEQLASYLKEQTMSDNAFRRQMADFRRIPLENELEELRVEAGSFTPELIRKFPALKATGLRENWDTSHIEIWYSESGFSGFTDFRESENYDGEHERGASGRWASTIDCTQEYHTTFTWLQTGLKCSVAYWYPFLEKWTNGRYLLEISGHFYSKVGNYSEQFRIKKGRLIGYDGPGGCVRIPTGVLEIEETVFREDMRITEVTIPGTLKEVSHSAFQGCRSLQKVQICHGVHSIGFEAFRGCEKLMEIELPVSLQTIGTQAFCGCVSLTEIILPEALISIGSGAFSSCSSLVKIEFPASLIDIGWSAFSGCTALDFSSIVLPDKIKSVGGTATFKGCKNVPNILFNKAGTALLFYDADNLSGDYKVPDGIKHIGAHAFAGTRFRKITLPKSVETIGDSAFSYCEELKAINLPNGIKRISYGTFSDCSNLRSITIPEGVTNIDASAFMFCSKLQTVMLPESLNQIGDSAFSYCKKLQLHSLPTNLKSLGCQSFKDCAAIVDIRLPSGIKALPNGVFANAGLKRITLPDGLNSIGEEAFRDCNALEEIIIPDSVECIKAKAFQGCENLRTFPIPTNLKQLGQAAFKDCKQLEAVVIPGECKKIMQSTFSGCSNLKNVVLGEGIKTIGNKAFEKCVSLQSIYVPNTLPEADIQKAFARLEYIHICR